MPQVKVNIYYRLLAKASLPDGTKYAKGYVLTPKEFSMLLEEYRTLRVEVISIIAG